MKNQTEKEKLFPTPNFNDLYKPKPGHYDYRPTPKEQAQELWHEIVDLFWNIAGVVFVLGAFAIAFMVVVVVAALLFGGAGSVDFDNVRV